MVFLLLLNQYVDFIFTLFNNIVYRMFILCNNKIDVNEIIHIQYNTMFSHRQKSILFIF